MEEIADWLTRLGLPEYAGAFAENGIDVSVLPHLTDQDLKDIGVLLGHRRKILAAVAELPGKSPSASKPFPPLVEARDRYTTEPPQPAPVAPPPTESRSPACHGDVLRLLAASSKKGFSAHQLMRELGCQYNTAWFLHHRVMEAMRRGGLDLPPLGGEGQVVEADETYFGQQEKPEPSPARTPVHEGRQIRPVR
jgi:SAM domain (Sterile alpha motif)